MFLQQMTMVFASVILYALVLPSLVAFSPLPSQHIPLPHATTATAAEARAAKAKETWNRVAWAQAETRDEVISLEDSNTVTVFDQRLFDEFKTIRGTFFINGLSSSRIGPGMIHPMESHGYVKSLAFNGQGSLHLKASVVQTSLAQKERLLNCPVARGIMSSLAGSEYPACLNNALAPTERDTANLVATLWPPSDAGGCSDVDPMLIVASDNGSPYCIDPKTMKSKGTLEWCIPELAKAMGGKKMLAHARHDQKRERLVLCSTSFDLQGDNKEGNTCIEFLELDTSFRLVGRKEFKTRFMVCHDWMITDNYYVVPKNPARVKWADMTKFVMGSKLGVDVFEMDYDAVGEWILIPRHDDTEKAIECKADSFFNSFHVGPCYEENGEMVVYSHVFDRFRFGGEMGMQEFDPIGWSSSEVAPPPRLEKFVIDITSGKMKRRERLLVVDESSGADIPVDMPTFHQAHGNRCRYSYFAGALRPEGWFPFRSIVKMDFLENKTYNWDAGEDCVVSEATFIPRLAPKTEDDGFLVSIVHNAASVKSELVVWDAAKFHQGPIGTIVLGELMPWCVHGSFSPDYIA
jgi:all-trans-8'-apo-beta-carotenal 15,15'-oxygenase